VVERVTDESHDAESSCPASGCRLATLAEHQHTGLSIGEEPSLTLTRHAYVVLGLGALQLVVYVCELVWWHLQSVLLSFLPALVAWCVPTYVVQCFLVASCQLLMGFSLSLLAPFCAYGTTIFLLGRVRVHRSSWGNLCIMVMFTYTAACTVCCLLERRAAALLNCTCRVPGVALPTFLCHHYYGWRLACVFVDLLRAAAHSSAICVGLLGALC
jgi:hypothetical protein